LACFLVLFPSPWINPDWTFVNRLLFPWGHGFSRQFLIHKVPYSLGLKRARLGSRLVKGQVHIWGRHSVQWEMFSIKPGKNLQGKRPGDINTPEGTKGGHGHRARGFFSRPRGTILKSWRPHQEYHSGAPGSPLKTLGASPAFHGG